MRNDRIEIRPMAGALGAEIVNIDLALGRVRTRTIVSAP
jgi:hypothetical protein